VLRRTLVSAGYTVHTAADGDTGLARALDLQPDLVVLDVGLPKQSGLVVARELRERGFRAPLLMLTALDSVTDRVIGLDAGADDYLPKPFEQEELLARVRALFRRATLREDDVALHVADLTLEPLARRVTRGDDVLALTQKEYALLEYLMRHVGHIVTRDQITANVWKPTGEHVASNVIDVYISYLRAKIDAAGRIPLLHTVRGTGYLLSPTAPRSAIPR